MSRPGETVIKPGSPDTVTVAEAKVRDQVRELNLKVAVWVTSFDRDPESPTG
jgi:hypothetical protein